MNFSNVSSEIKKQRFSTEKKNELLAETRAAEAGLPRSEAGNPDGQHPCQCLWSESAMTSSMMCDVICDLFILKKIILLNLKTQIEFAKKAANEL